MSVKLLFVFPLLFVGALTFSDAVALVEPVSECDAYTSATDVDTRENSGAASKARKRAKNHPKRMRHETEAAKADSCAFVVGDGNCQRKDSVATRPQAPKN